MKAKDITVGATYRVTYDSAYLQFRVRVIGHNPEGGWDCINLQNGKALLVERAYDFDYELERSV